LLLDVHAANIEPVSTVSQGATLYIDTSFTPPLFLFICLVSHIVCISSLALLLLLLRGIFDPVKRAVDVYLRINGESRTEAQLISAIDAEIAGPDCQQFQWGSLQVHFSHSNFYFMPFALKVQFECGEHEVLSLKDTPIY
jgi:hypothetical protein